MGIDFSHCEARWGYMGFMNFRTKLATEAGIALHCMKGFAGGPSGKSFEALTISGESGERGKMPGFDKYVGRQPVIPWENIKDDIKILLDHSDCDGELTPEECAKVAPRLRELVATWAEDDRDKINGLLLAEGMDIAAFNRENLEFH
jgi:hypothetical protein